MTKNTFTALYYCASEYYLLPLFKATLKLTLYNYLTQRLIYVFGFN